MRDPAGKTISTFSSIWRLEAPGTWRIVFDKGSPVCDPVPLFEPHAASVPNAAAPRAPPSSRRRVKADAFAIFVSLDKSIAEQLSRLGIREANKLLKVPMQKKVHTVEDGPTR